MKALLIIFISIFINSISIAQDNNEGAIKLKDGTLIYQNNKNPFTITLIGDIDLSNYPIIGINGNLFEYSYGVSTKFGKTEKEILINFMKWEVDYLNKTTTKPIKSETSFMTENNLLINLWNFTNPALVNDEQFNKRAFYADFYHKGYVYRFCFMAFKGTKEEANNTLINYINKVNFYDEPINITKLQDAIRQGKNRY